MMNQQIKDEMQQRLIALQHDLTENISNNETELRQQLGGEGVDEPHMDFNHPADMIRSDPDYEKALNLIRIEREELAQVRGALERIADGSYGRCDECGTEIPLARLRAVPYTQHCKECQEMLDRQQYPANARHG